MTHDLCFRPATWSKLKVFHHDRRKEHMHVYLCFSFLKHCLGPFTQAIFVAASRWKSHLVYTRDFEVATIARKKKLHRVAATKIACVNEPIECHYDPIFDIHFFHFRTQRSSLNILPNFNLLRSIERRCFGTLFLWIYGRINFPCSNSWLKIGVNDVIFSKLRSDWNYNNDKCEKLHEYRGQRFCSSLCELLYWLLL